MHCTTIHHHNGCHHLPTTNHQEEYDEELRFMIMTVPQEIHFPNTIMIVT
jgi:hypothetical protein